MNEELIIQEKDLELVITEKKLGDLTTNAKEIQAFVASILPRYDIANYNDENIDQAKKDKAILNKAAKSLNAKRIEVEKEFMRPFDEFKGIVTETVKTMTECSGKIDLVVKQSEQIYKQKKFDDIKTFFQSENANLIDFQKVFKNEWLNKTASMKSVKEDILSTFARVENDIRALEGFPEDSDVLITLYRQNLDITATLQYANRLREQRERAKEAEEIKRKLEAELRAAPSIPARESPETSISVPLAESPKPGSVESPAPQAKEVGMLVRAFKVRGTRDQIIALGNFMNENEIEFEKINLQ
jgi:hypothetical protein